MLTQVIPPQLILQSHRKKKNSVENWNIQVDECDQWVVISIESQFPGEYNEETLWKNSKYNSHILSSWLIRLLDTSQWLPVTADDHKMRN